MRFGAAHRKLWGSVSCLAVLLGLLVAGCGGWSSPPPGGVTVAINPTIVRVVVTGTQQFAANVTGTASVATIAASNGAVRASNIVTITTTSPHGLTQGQTVVISGVTDTNFNGTFIIASVPSTTTFTYSQIGADATSGNGSVFNINVKWFVNDVEGGNATFGTITTGGLYTAPAALPPPATATIAANGALRASNTVTITTTATHSFVVGQPVVISGGTDASFNGTFSLATVTWTATFSHPQLGANAPSGRGRGSSFERGHDLHHRGSRVCGRPERGDCGGDRHQLQRYIHDCDGTQHYHLHLRPDRFQRHQWRGDGHRGGGHGHDQGHFDRGCEPIGLSLDEHCHRSRSHPDQHQPQHRRAGFPFPGCLSSGDEPHFHHQSLL